MLNNKLTKVFQSLTEQEIRSFEKFVQSPIHNRHQDVIRLFQYLRKHISGSKKALEKDRIYNFLFDDKESIGICVRHLVV